MSELKTIDEKKHAKLSKPPKFTFYWHQKDFSGPHRMHGISEAFCTWANEGVITRVVHACLAEELRNGKIPSNRNEAKQMQLALDHAVFEWLTAHNFPEELSSLYK